MCVFVRIQFTGRIFEHVHTCWPPNAKPNEVKCEVMFRKQHKTKQIIFKMIYVQKYIYKK